MLDPRFALTAPGRQHNYDKAHVTESSHRGGHRVAIIATTEHHKYEFTSLWECVRELGAGDKTDYERALEALKTRKQFLGKYHLRRKA